MAAAAKRFGEAFASNGHPVWHPPSGTGGDRGLRVNNSLCDAKVPFVPMDGQRVTWYTCGPTVYDVCHMGHARAYLTFDILRRILEDYFRYDIKLVVNVTDIDDKIIKRARCNKLLADYTAAHASDAATVAADAQAAVATHKAKLTAKLAELQEPLPADTPSRAVDERATLLKEAQLKAEQAEQTAAAVAAAVASGDTAAILQAAKDPLADALDAKLGHTVTDHAVFDQHARKFERLYLEDMDALGVRRPDVMTRVSEYVPQVVTFVEAIIARGFAYESNGSVYFHTAAFRAAGHHYPKLKVGLGADDAAASAAEMAEGEGALSQAFSDDKRSSSDFVLWKNSKPGEPAWPSPWGNGRPGWHIECSVMASDVLGDNMDIHAGGSDLRFPHHDNELAQSEACHGCHQWVNYFLHAGHLNIRGLKMSKSLKNFVTIRQALAEHSPRQLRLMFLLQPWDRAMYYSDQVMGDAKAKEALFKNFFGAIKAALRDDATGSDAPCGWRQEDKDLDASLDQATSRTHAALCDNFDTPGALAALGDLVSDSNKYMVGVTAPRHLLLRKAAMYVTRILRCFGLLEGTDDLGFPASGGGGDVESTVAPYLDAMVSFRDNIRTIARELKLTQLLEMCDDVRDNTMVDLGVRVEDRADGPSLWKLDDASTLRREVEEKKQKVAEAAAKKRANKIDQAAKELVKWQTAARLPAEYFRTGTNEGKYSEFDANHLPLKAADGTEVSKKALKNNEKELAKHVAAHAQLQEKGGDSFLQTLVDELAAMQLEA